MTDQTNRKTTLIEKDASATKDLPPKTVDKDNADKVKGGFAKPNVEATKKIV
ncbi:MAG: hypothetical protein JWL61_445 [Gemmatimonadetes bacterium]|jgi:hypothetical protein|nr:hypothetical protein [Gemmatimonadota bacterium]